VDDTTSFTPDSLNVSEIDWDASLNELVALAAKDFQSDMKSEPAVANVVVDLLLLMVILSSDGRVVVVVVVVVAGSWLRVLCVSLFFFFFFFTSSSPSSLSFLYLLLFIYSFKRNWKAVCTLRY